MGGAGVSAEALRMVMKAVEARGRSSFQTEIMLMQIRGLLNIGDQEYLRILEQVQHDEELLALSGKSSMKRPRLDISGPRTKLKTGAFNADAMPPPPSRSNRPATNQRSRVSDGARGSPSQGLTYRQQEMVSYGNDLLGRRVLRNWPDEGGWCEAIITDFNVVDMRWCLTYNYGHAGTEKWEWYNVAEPDPESCILTDEKVDLETYKAPDHETYTGVPPPAAFKEADFRVRLELNKHNARGLEGLRVELDQRRHAVRAEENVLDFLDRLEEDGKDREGVVEGLQTKLRDLDSAEVTLRRELEKLVDV